MTDIVERLRNHSRKAQMIEEHGLLSLAADEIERLRAEVKTLLQEPLTNEQRLCRLREAFPLAEQDGEP